MTPKIYFTIFSCLLFLLQTADGLLWIVTPNTLVYVQQGRYTTLIWHYEMEENETFLSSELANGKTDAFASRHPRENKYDIYKGSQTKYSISGKNHVGLTIFSTELGSHIYCCIVQFYTTSGKERKLSCATVFVYDRPCIIHHTPQLSCKQGDQVKLQCNATGYPEPRVRWIHRDTNKFIGNSSVTSLNITGKKSEGSYCCGAKNKFEEDTACTTVNVTDYAPINTVLSSNNPYAIRSEPLEMRCSASAFPPPTQFLWDFNMKQYNSSNGTYIFKVEEDMEDVIISCIPLNVYGGGPVEKRILPIYDKPEFTSVLPDERSFFYGSQIQITCKSRANPPAVYSLYRNNTLVQSGSTSGYFNVTLNKVGNYRYTCVPSNAAGVGQNKSIKVLVVKDLGNARKELATWLVILSVAGVFFILMLIFGIVFLIHRYCGRGQDRLRNNAGTTASLLSDTGNTSRCQAIQLHDMTGSNLTRNAESPASPRSVPQLNDAKQTQEPTTSSNVPQLADEEGVQDFPAQPSQLDNDPGESSTEPCILEYQTECL